MNGHFSISDITLAAVIAYLLGSIPSAYIAGRLRGVDIFKVGTRQAGATNVWRMVSKRLGAVVFFVDSAKGLGGLLAARNLGLHSEYLLIPGFAAILGHWNSPFAKFRGGDGVATLTGVGLGYAPAALAVPYALIAAVTLGWNSKLAHPTMWGALLGYIAFLVISLIPAADLTPVEVMGFTGLGIVILVHSYIRHRKLGRFAAEDALLAGADDMLGREASNVMPADGEPQSSAADLAGSEALAAPSVQEPLQGRRA